MPSSLHQLSPALPRCRTHPAGTGTRLLGSSVGAHSDNCPAPCAHLQPLGNCHLQSPPSTPHQTEGFSFFPCSISDRSFAHATPDDAGGQMRRVSSEAPQGNKRPQEVQWGFFFADPTAHTPDQTQQLVKAISTTFLSCEGFN